MSDQVAITARSASADLTEAAQPPFLCPGVAVDGIPPIANPTGQGVTPDAGDGAGGGGRDRFDISVGGGVIRDAQTGGVLNPGRGAARGAGPAGVRPGRRRRHAHRRAARQGGAEGPAPAGPGRLGHRPALGFRMTRPQRRWRLRA